MHPAARLAQLKAEAAGISALELGRRTGLDKAHVFRVLGGKFKPTPATLDKLSTAIHSPAVTFTAEAQLETGEAFQVRISAPADVVRRAIESGEIVIG